ncbi:biotin-dependent carboxyltransferase family protein [Robertmurraya kyonggiensis]|uniref:Biotin-dependent carboxyltransferase family protein n=1 Tax=Robertmurraya kyonggiensis TaxID=1037680 RepID=A0A4U1DAH3_9BACI|nr:biotin-dependent carboxyltransferase family protein [Robertmurraya kyonggiensis]TKC19484.1 biotin-dependent carboxyltransferase family protein [Robertmurraya kyonggiensis]
MMTIIKPGLFSTIQDLGRYGYQKYGVVVSGAMDSLSFRIANLLVGNEENTPVIEMTIVGPSIQFHKDSLIAICGGDLSPSIDGLPVSMGRPIFVKKDSTLQFGKCKNGARAYLAVSGGIVTPFVMGSASTYVRGQLGGVMGRVLQSGDQLTIGYLNELSKKIREYVHTKASENWFVPFLKTIHPIVRLLQGREFDLFTDASKSLLINEPFTITAEADRMGYRLSGPKLMQKEHTEMLSAAVTIGTIQVTPDGSPIILLADRQTTGGYPKIAQVISIDLPLLAQMKPMDQVRFQMITLEEAQVLFRKTEKYIATIKRAIELKFR